MTLTAILGSVVSALEEPRQSETKLAKTYYLYRSTRLGVGHFVQRAVKSSYPSLEYTSSSSIHVFFVCRLPCFECSVPVTRQSNRPHPAVERYASECLV